MNDPIQKKEGPSRFRRLRFVLFGFLATLAALWCIILVATYDSNRALAIKKYDQLKPGMTRKQFITIMSDVPSVHPLSYGKYTTCRFGKQFDLTVRFDQEDVMDQKSLWETYEDSRLRMPLWLELMLSNFGFGRVHRTWEAGR